MTKPALPPWWPRVSAVVGVVLTVLLGGVVALGATGGNDPRRTADGTVAAATGDSDADPAAGSPTPEAATSEESDQTGKASAPTKPNRASEPHEDDQRNETKPNRTERTDRNEPKATTPVDGRGRAGRAESKLAEQVEELLNADDQPGAAPKPPAAPAPAVFRVSSFNVLGHSHTTARGNKPRYAEGPTRMRWATQLLAGFDIDVVGFQEFELVQLNAFRRITGGRFAVYPGATLGRNPVRNSIAWRLDTWKLVSADTIPIPYFRGNRVPMPYVLLEHVSTGRRVHFINVHNPASVKGRGNNEPWRDLGTRLEIDLVKRLSAQTELPVVLMGDFNERAEVFCKVTGQGDMIAANGGTAAPCRPPANHGIDWIFGTRDVAFSDYARTRSGLVARTTDHPMIVATGRVG